MTASTCRHADRPLAFIVRIGKAAYRVRAYRIHPVGMVLDGSRGGSFDGSRAASAEMPDGDAWGRDTCDCREGLMVEPPTVRRRQRLRSSRAIRYQNVCHG
jgi:uncharacterized protein (DUF58 family)